MNIGSDQQERMLVDAKIVKARTGCVDHAQAQESSALINKALDDQFNLTIDATLPNAMEIITKNTGVPMREDPAIWDLLPWGRETKIQAKFEKLRSLGAGQ